MRQFLVAAALFGALVSTSVASIGVVAASPRADLGPTMIDAALTAHNAVRQRVAQTESQRLGGTVVIPNLSWDATVAAVAQDWANQQAARMQQGLAPQHRPNNVYGENMYWAWSSPNQPDLSPAAAVQSWANEQPFYDYASNSCIGGECGHYTQLVWSTTTQVGCGQATWTQDGKNNVFWVCNYAPAGNLTVNGQKLRPYSVTATPPPGTTCAYAWTRTLELGAQGDDVAELQRRLNAAGAALDVDGDFGPLTDQAVRAFQAAHQLTVDGSVGPQTQAALNQVCPDKPTTCAYAWTRTLELGAQGDDVAELQRRLNAAGAALDVDGDFGPLTDQAVRAFQAAHQLTVDGSVGPQTQAALNQVCPR